MPTLLSKKKIGRSRKPEFDCGQHYGQNHRAGTKLQAAPVKDKNPFAVALGKLGASKGGKARAASLLRACSQVPPNDGELFCSRQKANHNTWALVKQPNRHGITFKTLRFNSPDKSSQNE
jgi:hypothetical protein